MSPDKLKERLKQVSESLALKIQHSAQLADLNAYHQKASRDLIEKIRRNQDEARRMEGIIYQINSDLTPKDDSQ